MSKYQIHATYSPDDGGCYAEVYERASGKTVYTTRTHPNERAARIEAMYWAENAVLTTGA